MTAPLRNHGRSQAAWEKMCLNKVRFPDEYVARARTQQIIQAGGASKSRLWVYHCPNCRGWHMTSSAWLNKGVAPVTKNNLYGDDPVPANTA